MTPFEVNSCAIVIRMAVALPIEDVTGAADILFLHVATRFLSGAFLIILGALGLTRSGCRDSTVFSRVR